MQWAQPKKYLKQITRRYGCSLCRRRLPLMPNRTLSKRGGQFVRRKRRRAFLPWLITSRASYILGSTLRSGLLRVRGRGQRLKNGWIPKLCKIFQDSSESAIKETTAPKWLRLSDEFTSTWSLTILS